MNKFILPTLLLSLLFVPGSVWAYGGPGSVVSGIGTLVAIVATLVAAIFGFLWYPIKILFKKLFGDKKEKNEKEEPDKEKK